MLHQGFFPKLEEEYHLISHEVIGKVDLFGNGHGNYATLNFGEKYPHGDLWADFYGNLLPSSPETYGCFYPKDRPKLKITAEKITHWNSFD